MCAKKKKSEKGKEEKMAAVGNLHHETTKPEKSLVLKDGAERQRPNVLWSSVREKNIFYRGGGISLRLLITACERRTIMRVLEGLIGEN